MVGIFCVQAFRFVSFYNRTQREKESFRDDVEKKREIERERERRRNNIFFRFFSS